MPFQKMENYPISKQTSGCQELEGGEREELTEDSLMEMNASEPGPDGEDDVEEAEPEQTDITQSGRRALII